MRSILRWLLLVGYEGNEYGKMTQTSLGEVTNSAKNLGPDGSSKANTI